MSKISKTYSGDPQWLERMSRMHPLKLLVYLAMIGVIILFGFLAFGFAITNNTSSYYLPKYFTISSICIMLSSITLIKSLQYYKSDNPNLLNRYLVTTFLFGLLFIGSQMKGWKELFDKGILFDGEANGSYLYLLSGLHLLHFFGAIFFFLFVYFRAFAAYRDQVKNLVYITDPYEFMLLDLMSVYWHLMDFLWIALYILFWYFSL